jgi:hypothetical protein
MKEVKNLKIITWTIINFFFVVFIVLLFTDLKFHYADMFDWLSLFISVCALVISILSIKWAYLNQKENDYKKFVINFLERKRNSIINMSNNMLSAMKEQLDFDEDVFNNSILNSSIYNEIFQTYYYKFSPLINNYKNLLENKRIGEDNDSALFDVCVEFEQTKVFFEEEIDEIIKNIYQGKIKIKDIK